MSNIGITIACGDYDRVQALKDGRVQVEGLDVTFVPFRNPPELFWRAFRYNEFDVTELSMAGYIIERSKNIDRFIAIPVFPSRAFRHSYIYVNTGAGIVRPEDLKGKKVGIPEYTMTAALWIRAMLQHEYNVFPEDIKWRQGGQEEPGRKEKVEFNYPDSLDIEPIPSGKTLNQMLYENEIDALITANEPKMFLQGSPRVRRLFEDYKSVEMDYFRKTSFFPIMHTIALKKEIFDRYPWVAFNVYKAFSQAKDLCIAEMHGAGALKTSLAWQVSIIEEHEKVLGSDIWPYGMDANRKIIEAMTQYSFEQGLTERKVAVEELFAPNTLKLFKH